MNPNQEPDEVEGINLAPIPPGYELMNAKRPDELPPDWQMIHKIGCSRKVYLAPDGHKCHSMPQFKDYQEKLQKKKNNDNGAETMQMGAETMQYLCDSLSQHGKDVHSMADSIWQNQVMQQGRLQASADEVNELRKQLEWELKLANDDEDVA